VKFRTPNNTMKVRLSVIGSAAALALVGTSAALAGISPDDRALPKGTSWTQVAQGTGTLPDDRALARGTSWTVTSKGADDRALARGTSWTVTSRAADDRALARGTSWTVISKGAVVSPDDRSFARSFSLLERPTLVSASSGGFDWTDAGIGAASGFGIALVLFGAGLVLLRRGTGGPVAA
jgi:hypothetical protein